MIEQLRERINLSFKDLEQGLWFAMLKEFAAALAALLVMLDDQLMALRDRDRYEVKDRQTRTLATLFGRDVTFKRRRYRDTQTGKSVYLLDEVLAMAPRKQTSPGLEACMLRQAVTTSSYRLAAESLKQNGFPAVSHEAVRQAVLQIGAEVENAGAADRRTPQGQRRVQTLFLEVDGMMVSLQQEKKRHVEERILTVHEGWERRHPSSNEFRLKRVKQFRTQDNDFWEQASRFVYSHYDIDEQTLVVINGDRAAWIRQGVDYFPNAMYQVDRFHLKRDLNRLFGKASKEQENLKAALDDRDVTGATFIATLAEATGRLTDTKARKKAQTLLDDLAGMPEATVDYRRRMRAQGRSTVGLRGVGAAESQVDRLSDRAKGRGRSWRPRGVSAMMELLCCRNSNRFEDLIERLQGLTSAADKPLGAVKQAAKRAVRNVAGGTLGSQSSPVPISHAGRNRSGGLSDLFHRINESGMLTT